MLLGRVFEGSVCFGSADLTQATDRRVAKSRFSVRECSANAPTLRSVPRPTESHRALRSNLGRAIGVAEQAEQKRVHGRARMNTRRSNRGRKVRRTRVLEKGQPVHRALDQPTTFEFGNETGTYTNRDGRIRQQFFESRKVGLGHERSIWSHHEACQGGSPQLRIARREQFEGRAPNQRDAFVRRRCRFRSGQVARGG